MPAATVVLNSYNQAPFLAASIESALQQTVDDIEVLVLDNGSTDESPDIIREHAARDPRIREWLHRENAPITQRFNEAVAEASSPFVSFLYSDDLLLPDKLERQLAMFDRLPGDCGVVYAPAEGWNVRTGHRWTYGSVAASGWVLDDLLGHHFAGQIDMVSPLTRTECLRRHRFYEDVFAEGEGIFFRIALTHRFHFDPRPVAVLRDHGGNAGKAVRRNAEMTMVMLERLEVHPDLPDGAAPRVRRFRAELLRSYAWQAARLGEEPSWIRHSLAEALRLEPRLALSPRALGAVALAMIPRSARIRLNRWGSAIRRGPGNDVLVDAFEEGS